jgi:hypothetical protein
MFVVAALHQSWQALHATLTSPRLLNRCASNHRYSPYPTDSDREYAIFHHEQHRCISSSSQTDPPLSSRSH